LVIYRGKNRNTSCMSDLQRGLRILSVKRSFDGKFIRVVLGDYLAESIIDMFQPDGHGSAGGIFYDVVLQHRAFSPIDFDDAEPGDQCSRINAQNDHRCIDLLFRFIPARTPKSSGGNASHFLVVDIEVCMHFLHVVVIFKRLQQLQQMFRIPAFHAHEIVCDEMDLRRFDFQAFCL